MATAKRIYEELTNAVNKANAKAQAPKIKGDPTRDQFAAYSAMYDYFNRTLFGGRLSPVFLNFSRASARTRGFFAPSRWAQGASATHEISLCPAHLALRPAKDTASTLVHEMVHAWQEEHGKPGRGRYHNQEWADEMKAIGLQPSDTGEVGGAETGDSMTHYIVKGGAFDLAFDAMPAACQLPWTSFELEKSKSKRKASKVKFTCPTCSVNAWGKPALSLMCGECEEHMVPELADDEDADGDAS